MISEHIIGKAKPEETVVWIDTYLREQSRVALLQRLDGLPMAILSVKKYPPTEDQRAWRLHVVAQKRKEEISVLQITITPHEQNLKISYEYDDETSNLVTDIMTKLANIHGSIDESLPKLKVGRPHLDREEEVTRIAYAIWAEELRQQSIQEGDRKIWREIAIEIGLPYSKLKDARMRLSRLKDEDPDDIIPAAKKKLKEVKEINENK